LLPLKSDIVFKLVFGDHRNIGIVRAFLVAALDIPEEEYEDLEIIDPHLERDSPDDKLGILDVRIKLKNKKLVSVEVQVRKVPDMAERLAFSTGRNLSRQISPGDKYEKIARVVTIAIADMEIHTLELRKLPETPVSDAKENELLDWLRLIRSEKEEEIEMLATKTKEMKMAVGSLKKLSADEQTRMIYEAREMHLERRSVPPLRG
jgi:hypothetical protein